jgi:hypothetical protein
MACVPCDRGSLAYDAVTCQALSASSRYGHGWRRGDGVSVGTALEPDRDRETWQGSAAVGRAERKRIDCAIAE